MFPDSGFAHPEPSFTTPVPLTGVDIDAEPFLLMKINVTWVPYIAGALKQLVLQSTWATDDPDALWLQQQRVMMIFSNLAYALAHPKAACDCDENNGVEFDGEELMSTLCEALRFHNGKLQAFCCGAWVDVDGQPAQGIGGSGQPGGGSPQPQPGGGSECYTAQLQANGTWLVPTVVNSGDTIELTDATGAGQDGTVSPWRCPNGQTFFAGACVGAGGAQAGDPLVSANHMRLIFNVNGTYYDAMSGPVTIPGGVSNAQVTVQVNDSTLTDNSGSYNFKVCATNNTLPSWSHDIDLTISPAGFVAFDGGNWSPGVGLQSTQVDGSPNNGQQLAQVLEFPADVAFTHIGIEYNTTLGSHGGTVYHDIITEDVGGTGTVRATVAPPVNGSSQVLSYNGAITIRRIKLVGVVDVVHTPTATDGNWTIYTLSVAGQGYDPFV